MARWIRRGALALLGFVLLALLSGWLALRDSLPRLDGEQPVAGLGGAVTVQRDALGVVTIDAGNRVDAMRAQQVHLEVALLCVDPAQRPHSVDPVAGDDGDHAERIALHGDGAANSGDGLLTV